MKKYAIAAAYAWTKDQDEKDVAIPGGVVRYYVNKLPARPDFVCDFGDPFQPLSARVAPERRVYVPTEPSPILGMNEELASRVAAYYQGLILAWHAPLMKYPQTINYTAILCWVKSPPCQPSEKVFGVSGFVSAKDSPGLEGYGVRRAVLANEGQIKIPSMVWNFRGHWQGRPHAYPVPSKAPGMHYMFHFAIENHKENGYFTEKIMDCFRTYTVPLYYGDPTIVGKFDRRGIIMLDPAQPARQASALTEDDYRSRLPYVMENFRRSEKYMNGTSEIMSLVTTRARSSK